MLRLRGQRLRAIGKDRLGSTSDPRSAPVPARRDCLARSRPRVRVEPGILERRQAHVLGDARGVGRAKPHKSVPSPEH
jgi:hypothetical protein